MDQAILNSDPIVTCEPEAPEPPMDYEFSQEISTPNFNDSLDSYTREINQSNYYTNIDLPTITDRSTSLPTSSHPITNFNLPSSTAVHPCDVYPESSGMIQIPQTLNPVQESPLVSEPSCAVCLKSCSNAHLYKP